MYYVNGKDHASEVAGAVVIVAVMNDGSGASGAIAMDCVQVDGPTLGFAKTTTCSAIEPGANAIITLNVGLKPEQPLGVGTLHLTFRTSSGEAIPESFVAIAVGSK